MIEELRKEIDKIKKSWTGMTLSDIYEERQADLQRLDEIHDEIWNKKNETHNV